MPCFAECSVPSVVYRRGETVTNEVVNLDLCTKMRKGRYKWYPDNTGLPCIEFDGLDAKWVFESEATRDAEFSRIAAIR